MTDREVEQILRDFRRLWKDVKIFKEINPKMEVDYDEISEEMTRCLSLLRQREREAIYHRLIKGEKWHVVSAAMGYSRGTIYRDYLRPGVEKLKTIFSESPVIMRFYSRHGE